MVLAITALGVVGVISYQNIGQKEQPNTENTDASSSSSDTKNNTTNTRLDTESEETGTIEGSLTYPSDFIPDSMVIYAQNIDTEKEYFTSEHLQNDKYRYGYGFKLDVPVGRYYIYATIPGRIPEKSYSDECMKNVYEGEEKCSSYEKVIYTVSAGRTVTDFMAGY